MYIHIKYSYSMMFVCAYDVHLSVSYCVLPHDPSQSSHAFTSLSLGSKHMQTVSIESSV